MRTKLLTPLNRRLLAAAGVLWVTASVPAAGQELTANSAYFSVSDYYTPSLGGDFQPYSARGFYEPGGPNAEPRLFLLPAIRFSQKSARFFDADGRVIDPSIGTNPKVDSITLTAEYSDVLPNAFQQVGIGSALAGGSSGVYLLEPLKNTQGQPFIYSPAAFVPDIVAAINAIYKGYDEELVAQRTLAAKWKNYQSQSLPLNELSIALAINGEEIAARTFSGSLMSAPQLFVSKPSKATVNRIRSGDYEVLLSYRFTDSRVALIEAELDVSQIIRNFLSDTQKAITQNKSSGFSVFGLGYRRSRIKQSITRKIESTASNKILSKTRIVMTDANDDMIREFEAAFFPEMKMEAVITRHFEAAEQAGKSGNQALQAAHLEYARALQAQDKLKEVDAVAAAAALSAGNYAMFVAEGVRAQISDDNNSAEFRRVINNSADIQKRTEWTQARKVSAQREISDVLRPVAPVDQKAWLGIMNAQPCPYFVSVQKSTIYGVQLVPENRKGVMVMGVLQASPAANSGLLPGMIIDAVNGNPVTTTSELLAELDSAAPGVPLRIRVWDAASPATIGGAYATLSVTPVKGAPRK